MENHTTRKVNKYNATLDTIYSYLCFLPMWQSMCFCWKKAQEGTSYMQVNILFFLWFLVTLYFLCENSSCCTGMKHALF